MGRIVTPENFGMYAISNDQVQMQMGADIQRIAVGLDMLVGLLSEHWGYELKEEKFNGNTVLRWRPINSKETESESEESTDREA